MRATTATTSCVAVISLIALPTYAADWTGKGEASSALTSSLVKTTGRCWGLRGGAASIASSSHGSLIFNTSR